MADIFDEVDEDLRQERLEASWRRWQPAVFGAAAAIVLATAGWSWWRQHQLAGWQDEGATFTALDARGQPSDDTLKQLEILAARGDTSYALLARFKVALAKAHEPDPASGVAALRAIAADSGVAGPYRDLAAIEAAGFGLDHDKPETILADLQPYLAAGNPWRFTAREYAALAAVKQGKPDEAVKQYQQLADDPDAPPSLRARSAEILAAMAHRG